MQQICKDCWPAAPLRTEQELSQSHLCAPSWWNKLCACIKIASPGVDKVQDSPVTKARNNYFDISRTLGPTILQVDSPFHILLGHQFNCLIITIPTTEDSLFQVLACNPHLWTSKPQNFSCYTHLVSSVLMAAKITHGVVQQYNYVLCAWLGADIILNWCSWHTDLSAVQPRGPDSAASCVASSCVALRVCVLDMNGLVCTSMFSLNERFQKD